MTGGDLLQVMMVAVADATGSDQGATSDGRPESADHAAAADQLRLVVIRRGRGRRVGHHRHPAAACAGHRLEITSASEHHFVTGQMVLKCKRKKR